MVALDPGKIHVIGLRMDHHASASGYGRLLEFINCDRILQPARPNHLQRGLARIFRRQIRSSGSTWYHRNQFITELSVVSRWFAGQSQIFHFLYGENSFRFIGGLKRLPKRNYLIATYHTPPARFEQVVRNRAHLSSLDAIITMSSSQREYFTQYLDPDRVFFVPHGVDTETYRPETESKFTDAMLHCIFVGSHLRDFETLKRVIELVAKADDKIKFCIVTDDRYHGKFTDLKGVDLLSRVSDKHLLELYQASDLLLLPVTEATANNSLLEAMACGLPILATDLPGIRDYIDPACSVLTKMRDAEAMAKEILTLKADPERRMLMARASRVQAERLSWPRIAEQVQGVYRSLV